MSQTDTKANALPGKVNIQTIPIVLPANGAQEQEADSDGRVVIPRLERSESCF